VFCVGFHKTGTTSLQAALQILGYRVCGVRLELASSLLMGDVAATLRLTDRYDAFRDNPWPALYRELDVRHPKSRFILTTRTEDAWLHSVVRHFGTSERRCVGFTERDTH
jgi:hypothetical protein